LREFVDVFCNKEDETRERALKILLTAVGREVLDLLETAIGRDSTSKVGTYLLVLNEEKFVTQPVYRSITRPPQEAWIDRRGLDEHGYLEVAEFVVWKGSVAELKRKAAEQGDADSSSSWASTFLLLYQQVSLLLRSLGRRGGRGTAASTGLEQHQLYQRPPLVNVEDDLEAALEAFRERKEEEGVESCKILNGAMVSSFRPGFEQRWWENLGQYVRKNHIDLLKDEESLFDQDSVELFLVARWEYEPGLTDAELQRLPPDAEEAVYDDLCFDIEFFGGMMKADLRSTRTPMIAEQEEHGALQHPAPAGAGGASSSAFLGDEYYRSTG
ncbi:unnamed protein product, partial [Amoebophrya sp. A25]